MTDKEKFYSLLLEQADRLLEDEHNKIANLANISALLFQKLEDISWAGFYLCDGEDTLVLGPFQGKPACVRIPFGKGVCGTAALYKKSQLVPNVHKFPTHITCDSAANSELVIPIFKNEETVCVLDLDSVSFSRFDEADAENLEKLAQIIADKSDF